jgi:hypothetical protein
MRVSLVLAVAIAIALPICAQAKNGGEHSNPPNTTTKKTTSKAPDKPIKPFIKLEDVKGESKDKDHNDKW